MYKNQLSVRTMFETRFKIKATFLWLTTGMCCIFFRKKENKAKKKEMFFKVSVVM